MSPAGSDIDPRILGQLLVVQSAFSVSAARQKMGEFVCRAVEGVPGLTSAAVCLPGAGRPRLDGEPAPECADCDVPEGDVDHDPSHPCRLSSRAGIQTLPLQTQDRHFGFFFLKVTKPERYSHYAPFVDNLVNSLAVSIERQWQRGRLEAANVELRGHREHLEELVLERTAELQLGLKREHHLNAVLRAIRNVNQLIVREKDRECLLQQTCGILAEARGFRCVWIVRLGTDGRVEAMAEAGIGPPFAGLRSQLERGELPECCRRALASEGPVVLANPVVNCAACSLPTEYRDTAGIAAPLRHEGRTYGVLIAALPAEMAADAEEISLFAEAAGDLAFALHSIEVEQARQQAGEAVRDSEARYRALFQGTADGILIANLETKLFKYANPAVCRLLGYSEAELRTMGVADIHPKADLPAVLAEFEAQARGDKALAAGLPCLRKDGTIIYADVSATAMSLDSEACTAGFFRDITERKRAQEALSRSLEATLSVLGHAAEMRDPYTAGHQRRVTALATALARKLGLPDDACDTLRIAGLLHDVGKLGIPAEILSKPSQLSAIEFALIRQHPHIAYDLLTDIPFPGPVAEIVLQHHERLDGSGYPHALMGGQILREARILAVADVVEAMASHRPYRPALGIDAALTEIRAGRETRYDQQVVDACVALFESGEFSFQPATAG